MYLSPQEGSTGTVGLGAPSLSMGDNLGSEGFGNVPDMLPLGGSEWNGQGDAVSLTTPPQYSTGAFTLNSSGASSMFAPLFSALGSLFSQMSQMFSGSNGSQSLAPNLANCTQRPVGQSPNPEQSFTSATASSTGDPHLAFNGQNANGTNLADRWDNMSSHGDLLESNSFAGGYRVSTQATQPNQNGITYNQDASVSTDGGNVAVSLDAKGNATFTRNGNATSIQSGQSYKLGKGESVTRNSDGSVVVDDHNAQGGSIQTTLTDNGSGVDVSVAASNVNLGGYLPNAAAGQVQTLPAAIDTNAP